MRKLTKDEIEVKVKTVSEKGATLLLYKTARVDMAILDETYGAMNWQSDYKVVKDNLYCGIGVRNGDTENWVWKWDCGIESRADDEGNEKKGEASDAFKRAGFKWGIGVELYSAPFTFAKVETVRDGEDKNGRPVYKLKDKFQKFYVSELSYDPKSGDISELEIVDDKGVLVYSNIRGRKPQQPKETKQEPTKKDTPSNDQKVKDKIEECKKSIASHVGKYTDGDADHAQIARFANKIYSLGYEKEGNEIIRLLEEKTEPDYIPFDKDVAPC